MKKRKDLEMYNCIVNKDVLKNVGDKVNFLVTDYECQTVLLSFEDKEAFEKGVISDSLIKKIKLKVNELAKFVKSEKYGRGYLVKFYRAFKHPLKKIYDDLYDKSFDYDEVVGELINYLDNGSEQEQEIALEITEAIDFSPNKKDKDSPVEDLLFFLEFMELKLSKVGPVLKKTIPPFKR